MRACVLRVSPLPRLPDPAADGARPRTAGRARRWRPPSRCELLAADEGTLGRRRWRCGCEFDVAAPFRARLGGAPALSLPGGVAVPAGSLLRLRGAGLPPPGCSAGSSAVEPRDDGPGRRAAVAVLDRPLTGSSRPRTTAVERRGRHRDAWRSPTPTRDLRRERALRRPRAARGPPAVRRRRCSPSESRLVAPGRRLAGAAAAARPAADAGRRPPATEPGATAGTAIGRGQLLRRRAAELLPVGGAEPIRTAPTRLHGVDRMAAGARGRPARRARPVLELRRDGRRPTEPPRPAAAPAFAPCRADPAPGRRYRRRRRGRPARRRDGRAWPRSLAAPAAAGRAGRAPAPVRRPARRAERLPTARRSPAGARGSTAATPRRTTRGSACADAGDRRRAPAASRCRRRRSPPGIIADARAAARPAVGAGQRARRRAPCGAATRSPTPSTTRCTRWASTCSAPSATASG